MIDRFNSIIKKGISYWHNFASRQTFLNHAGGYCCVGFQQNEIFLVHIRQFHNKQELLVCENFPIAKNQNFQSVLKSLVDRYSLKDIPCSFMLSADQYQLLFTEALPVKPDEFQSAIRWKIKDLISFPIDEAVVDSFPVPLQKARDARKMIMVAVAKMSDLKKITTVINNSGLVLDKIDIAELGLRNITALFETDDKSSALIVAQAKLSRLIITRSKNLYLTRILDFGLDSLSSLSETDNIEFQMDRLALEIQRSFDYFQSNWRCPAPSRIFWSAEKELTIDVIEALSKRLSLPLQLLNLNELLDVRSKGFDFILQAKCLPYIGGALKFGIAENANDQSL